MVPGPIHLVREPVSRADLANVGSEVHRAVRAHQSGNMNRWTSAFARALELFDLTATDPRWRGPRRREILRARAMFCALFFSDEPTPGDAAYLEHYFYHFAVAARRE